jgi:hypothetical protein
VIFHVCFFIVHVFNIFAGEVIHNGMDSDEHNYRLFFYCPTRDNQVSWSYKQAKVNPNKEIKDSARKEELDGAFKLIFASHQKADCNPAKTDPCQDLKFDKQMYHDYMYDSVERYCACACPAVCVLK